MRTFSHRSTVAVVSIVLAGLLVIPLIAVPARADHGERDRDRGRVELRGIVVGIDWRARAFHVQARRRLDDQRVWVVLVDRRTEFRGSHDDDDFDADHDRPRRGLRRLAVGDAVEVEGRLLDRGTILAREIEVFRRGRLFQGPGHPLIGLSIPAPVISFPGDGALVRGPEFFLTGRTVGRARVFIQVVSAFGPVTFQTVNVETTSDDNGFFSTPIRPTRPSILVRGLQHQITVTAEHQGVQSPPTTLIVRQD